ncbi:MAG: RDD family protein [Acidobacteria bacterium]|nr:RDD family protein [Acidobacteriota bacterium]
MKCNKCGKEQSEKAIVCPYCGFRFIKEMPKETLVERSTLIEFPSNSTHNKPLRNNSSSTVSSNNDWRAELSAKVRQVKERRNMQEARGRLQAELEAAAHRYQQANSQTALAATTLAPSLTTMTDISSGLDLEADRPTNPVIEAALKRAQRASEIAVKKQAPSNIASVVSKVNSQSIAQSSLSQPVGKSNSSTTALATALVEPLGEFSSTNTSTDISLEKDLETDVLSSLEKFSNLESSSIGISKLERETVSMVSLSPRIISTLPKTLSTPTLGATAVAPLVIEEEEILEIPQVVAENVPITEEISTQNNQNLDFLPEEADSEAYPEVDLETEVKEPKRAVRIIKESEAGPNYLDELIAVCEQNRSLSSEAANASQRLIAASIDLLIIAIAGSIFWGSSYVLGVNFSDERILIMLGSASLLVGLIYLTMMVFVSARTFGMMFVGTRVINNNTKESPSILQAFLRAIGYFISVGLLGLGFAWMFLDHERRTLHDVVSGTFVVRDY